MILKIVALECLLMELRGFSKLLMHVCLLFVIRFRGSSALHGSLPITCCYSFTISFERHIKRMVEKVLLINEFVPQLNIQFHLCLYCLQFLPLREERLRNLLASR